MYPRAMIILIFTVITVISPTVLGSLKITAHDYSVMHCTKLISEEHFTAGHPLVIVLPLGEEESTKKEVGYLIEELHKSGRWPILVYNVGYKMNGNMYTDMLQYGTYIILTSGPCMVWEDHITLFSQQLHELFYGTNTKDSLSPRAKFVVSVMSNCKHFDNKLISRAILENLWNFKVTHAAVLFLKSNESTDNDLQQNTNHSTKGTYVELHTWYPYEISDRCNPSEGTVPVKVFNVRNLSDIRRSDIFRGYFDKNFHRCPIIAYVREMPLLVYSTEHIWYNNSNHQYFYVDEWEVELLRVIGKALTMTLHIMYLAEGKGTESLKDIQFLLV